MAAEIHKLQKNGVTIYPATTTDAVVDPGSKKSIGEIYNVYNVTRLHPLSSGEYYTFDTAVRNIPSGVRRQGLIITYRISNDEWEQAQYCISSSSDDNFFLITNWTFDIKTIKDQIKSLNNSIASLGLKDGLFNVNKILNNPSNYYTLETAIKSISSADRFIGMIITFRKSNNEWDQAQYLIGSFTDENFFNTQNWHLFSSDKTELSTIKNGLESLSKKVGLYNVNVALGKPSYFYSSLLEAISSIPQEDRYVNMIISYRSSSNTVEYAQYKVGNITDTYFLKESNWTHWSKLINDLLSGTGENELSAIKSNTIFDYTDSAILNTVITTGGIEIGETIDLTTRQNSTYSLIVIPCHKDDKFTITGIGGSGFRLWAFIDSENKLLSVEEANKSRENLVLFAPENGKLIININLSVTAKVIGERIYDFKTAYYPEYVALGDSITDGTTSYFDEGGDGITLTKREYSWAYIVSKINSYKLSNYAIGGTGYVMKGSDGTKQNAKELIQTINLTNAKIVTLAYGINDYKGNQDLGSIDDDIESSNTFIANMRYVIEYIINKNPYCKIYVLTPLNAKGYSGELGDYNTNYAINHPNSNGKTLDDFVKEMINVCEYYGIQYINLTKNSIVNRKNIETVLPDGVHPTQEIQKINGQQIAKILLY